MRERPGHDGEIDRPPQSESLSVRLISDINRTSCLSLSLLFCINNDIIRKSPHVINDVITFTVLLI